ncbi:MAG: zinc-ribbon domain-containing protein, partial [bacterium]|nr:zinc-ribbon domain-containing protein [bacterium]
MFCPKCGYRNPDNAKFCMKCGIEIPANSLEGETLEIPKEYQDPV